VIPGKPSNFRLDEIDKKKGRVEKRKKKNRCGRARKRKKRRKKGIPQRSELGEKGFIENRIWEGQRKKRAPKTKQKDLPENFGKNL